MSLEWKCIAVPPLRLPPETASRHPRDSKTKTRGNAVHLHVLYRSGKQGGSLSSHLRHRRVGRGEAFVLVRCLGTWGAGPRCAHCCHARSLGNALGMYRRHRCSISAVSPGRPPVRERSVPGGKQRLWKGGWAVGGAALRPSCPARWARGRGNSSFPPSGARPTDQTVICGACPGV